MKKVFFVLIVMLISLQNVNIIFCQELRILSDEIRSTKDNVNKKKLIRKLASMKPHSPKDVEDLVGVAETAKDNDEKKAAFGALQNVNEESRQQLSGAYTKALDSKDKDTRIYTMIGIGKMKAIEAAPKIREIVKGFGKSEYLAYKTMEKVNPHKAVEMITEASTAAQTLGDIKDEEAIPILVDKYEELGVSATMGLSKIGKKALPALLDLARNEIDYRQAHIAQQSIAGITDKDAKQDFIHILKTETNRDIRMRVLDALQYNMFDDEILQVIEELYTKEKDILFMSAMKTKKAIPFLINILKNDENRDNRARAASVLGDIKDFSAVPSLEEAVKDRDSYVRRYSADSLQKITGKKYDWKKK